MTTFHAWAKMKPLATFTCVSTKNTIYPRIMRGQKVHEGFFIGKFSFLPMDHAWAEIKFCRQKL